MSNEYPDYPPQFPAFLRGRATVKGSDPATEFLVDFDTGECECPHGAAWRWTGGTRGKWVPNAMCNHKLKALASLVKHTDSDEVRDFYEIEVGRRQNPFEAISVLHKEVRRRDVKAALYWASVIVPHRGRHGVVLYLRNICFEETRDLSLARYLYKVSSKGKSVSRIEMQRAVRRFCEAPKKWELPWRREIFLNEMRAYKQLGERFGYEVSSRRDILPAEFAKEAKASIIEGFAQADPVKVQYGLKGWYKTKSPDHDEMKIEIFNVLVDVLNGEHKNKFDYDQDHALAVHSLLMQKLRTFGGMRYHELNVFCDALTGEPGGDPRATLPRASHKRIVAHPRVYRMPLGVFKRVPLYAQDNHTYKGKALMKRHRAQLRPGATQSDIDFRMCGAYMGVAWRTLAMEQHGTIDCKWGDVSWSNPSWLWTHLDKMFY